MNVGGLHGPESGLQVGVPDAHDGWEPSLVFVRGRRAAHHVDHDDELDAGVGQPTVGGETLVDGLEKAQILIEGLRSGPDVEDVEAGIQQELHFQVFVLVRWEQGDVERVVLNFDFSKRRQGKVGR